MIFCQVDEGLVKVLKRIAGNRLIVNCGAGEDELHHKMPNVLAIDLFSPEHLPDVVYADATSFPFPSGSLPVFLLQLIAALVIFWEKV